MLVNAGHLSIAGKTSGNGDVVLQKNFHDNFDAACKPRGSFKQKCPYAPYLCIYKKKNVILRKRRLKILAQIMNKQDRKNLTIIQKGKMSEVSKSFP